MNIQNLQQKKWYVIDSESKGSYSHENPIKFLTNSLESCICDYSDAYILVTGNINETFIGEAVFVNITMPMYNLIEYSDNYSDTSGSLWQYKRDETINNADVTNDNNDPSFKYKAKLIGDTVADGANRKKEGVKIAVPIKYMSNFWRSLEIPLINCRAELSLSWNENCMLSSAGTVATFTITDTKLYVPVLTLKTEDNTKLSKLLGEGFKRSVYWNK